MALRVAVTVAAYAVGAPLVAAAPAVTQQLVDTINAMQSSWTAHVSPRFMNATEDQVRSLCGTILKDDPRYREVLEPKDADDAWQRDIPSEFDVRQQWPGCAAVTGRIRDQSACGSCWAFASTEAFNDRQCIATGSEASLSPTDTVANCGFFQCFSMGCNGGQPGAAWRWFTRVGVVTGGDFGDIGKGNSCAPYPFQPCAHHVDPSPEYPKCPTSDYSTPAGFKQCKEASYPKKYEDDKQKASQAYSLNGVANIQRDMMQYGSATAAFTVYSDFPTYKSGVYHYTTGSALGGHAVKLLGWGTENGEDYWLVANSWNNQWGDHGTFKIRRGSNECGIEDQVTAGTAGAAPGLYI